MKKEIIMGVASSITAKDQTSIVKQANPYFNAAKQGNLIEIYSILRRPNFPVNQLDEEGNTALIVAAKHGQDMILKALVQQIKKGRQQWLLPFKQGIKK
jgi:ankyrin repeat protein